MNAMILGATQGMGQALARLMAARGHSLFLLGRNRESLERCASDLEARYGRAPVGFEICDLREPATFGLALDQAWSVLGRVDAVVVTAGIFDTQDRLEQNREKLSEMLSVNFTNTILFCEEARSRLKKQGGGTLCVFSSVAGDRGRKPVILYGATKAGLSYYLEALDHAERRNGLVVVCIKPGFVKTAMTAGLKPPPFAGEPESVARDVLRAIERGQPVVYTPRPWGLVMWVIRRLPRFLMRRINF
ncbi:MAG: SDR family NAD(P)-dependent oxidoreductase [Kiritimatiellae bacterium]|nr:SDR family NAD(P)-dependent oxidoreductase [Kiritimatiellia bacterium]MDW8458318.1 SDR family NAD(P)-dependent oxidoreductase [Verrucomicrobiota bacterium]